jgi:hypothetical protein
VSKAGPNGPSQDVRQGLLFRTLLKGREKKLGRGLTPEELAELEQSAARTAQAGVHTASKRSVSEAARAAVAALPKTLPAALLSGPTLPHRLPRDPSRSRRDLDAKQRRRAGRVVADVRVLLAMAIREGRDRKGPQLPAYARRCSAIYIQQDDLEPFIPDGWGAAFPAEAGAMGRAMGLPPLAIPLLCLLEWTSSFRPAMTKDTHGCGAGFQVSLDWLARKLGCTRVWVQALINRLDPYAQWRREMLATRRENRRRIRRREHPVQLPERPAGIAYVHRFRRLKRYEDTCPEAARRRIWIDADGKPHVYVDVRGVVYLTDAGRRVLGRPRTPLDAKWDVDRRGKRTRWLLAARLRRGHDLMHGRHISEVLETRAELLAAPGVPKNLSPNHLPPEPSTPS